MIVKTVKKINDDLFLWVELPDISEQDFESIVAKVKLNLLKPNAEKKAFMCKLDFLKDNYDVLLRYEVNSIESEYQDYLICKNYKLNKTLSFMNELGFTLENIED
ncbi:MAG: hypothetical protein ACP5PT_01795 [Brevinematia bacterium]